MISGWTIFWICLIMLIVGAVAFIIWRLRGKQEEQLSEKDQKHNGLLDDNPDLVFHLARPEGNLIFATSREIEGKNLGGDMIIHGFPRDIITKNGEEMQNPLKGKELFVKKGCLKTLANRKYSPRNIFLTIPDRVEDLPDGEIGKVLAPYVITKEANTSLINQLIKQKNSIAQIQELVATGEFEEMALKKIKDMKKGFVEDIARGVLDDEFKGA